MTCAQEKGKGCFQPLWQQYVKKEAGWAPRIIKRQQLSTLQVSVWLSWTGTGKRPSLCAAKKSEKEKTPHPHFYPLSFAVEISRPGPGLIHFPSFSLWPQAPPWTRQQLLNLVLW